MKNRRFLLMLVVFSLVFPLFAAVGTSPAATVNLIRNEIITYDMLDKEAKKFGAPDDKKLDVLNMMINDRVFLQGAEREGITVSAQQREELYRNYKTNYEQNTKVTLTTEQYEQMAIRTMGSVDEFKDALKNQYILENYIDKVKGDELKNLKVSISEDEISSYYRRNRANFYQDENVKLAHIYIPKEGDEKTDSSNRTLMNKVASDIAAGRITFEKAVKQYSKDEDSVNLGGEIGWLTMANEQALKALGADFFDSVFALEVGKVSPMIESGLGFHIVRVSVHNDGRILELDDRLTPEEPETVRDYIRSGLESQKLQNAYNTAVNELVETLRGEARVRILYK